MTNIFFCSLLEASIIVSVAILLLLIFHKRLTQYSPSCRMIFWMILACRLLIPCPVGILYFGTPPHNTALAVGLGIVWLIGAVLLFGGHLLAYLRFERKMQRGRAASALSMSEQYQIQAVFEKVKAALGVKSSVELWISAEASGPMLLGFLRPKVVLPDCMLAQEKLEMIFRHELLHQRRHDCWYRLLMLLTQSVHWFNPLVQSTGVVDGKARSGGFGKRLRPQCHQGTEPGVCRRICPGPAGDGKMPASEKEGAADGAGFLSFLGCTAPEGAAGGTVPADPPGRRTTDYFAGPVGCFGNLYCVGKQTNLKEIQNPKACIGCNGCKNMV